MEDEMSPSSSKRSTKRNGKTKSNMELLTGISPSKILSSARKPVLASNSSVRSSLKDRPTAQSARKTQKSKLSKFQSVRASNNGYEKLRVNTFGDFDGLNTAKVPLSTSNSVLENYDLIQEVEQGKQEIAEKKQRLRDLEQEIVTISDKIVKYQARPSKAQTLAGQPIQSSLGCSFTRGNVNEFIKNKVSPQLADPDSAAPLSDIIDDLKLKVIEKEEE